MKRDAYIPPFRPADAKKFRESAPVFADLVDYEQGRLWDLINSEGAYIRMVVLTQSGLPAVAGITAQLDPFLKPLDDRAELDPPDLAAERLADRLRRAIGSMVRAVMAENGYRKTGQLRAVPPEPRRIFRRAEVYALLPAREPTDFDWDAFAESARYAEVRRLSPELDKRRLPSMYSPGKARYYLTSLDMDVSCEDEAALRAAYQELRNSWGAQVQRPYERPLQLHNLRVDIGEIATLLMALVEDPEEFDHWEVELINSIELAKASK